MINIFLILVISTVIICFMVILLSSKNKNIHNDIHVERTLYSLGTIINLKLYGKNATAAIDDAIDRLHELDDKLSAYKDYSEISKINSSSGNTYQPVSTDTFDLLNNAIRYCEICEGAFDITIRPLVKLWNIGNNKGNMPNKKQIEKELSLVNYTDVLLDINTKSVKLKKSNQCIDLGGIAKGYAADEIKNIYIKHKIKNAIIDLGGNIYVLGEKEDGSDWKVGIQDPHLPRGSFMGILNIKNKSVVTSGYYEKYFEQDGKIYHHIIDPRTGYPSDNKIISATIVSDKSIDGDGLSTGIYIMGVDKSIKIIESLPGVDAILLTNDKKVYVTSGINKYFELTNNDYKYEK